MSRSRGKYATVPYIPGLFPPPPPAAFTPVARARASDPFPSHVAARRIEATGDAARQRTRCLAVLRTAEWPLTSREVADRAGLDRYQAARRLPELREDGLVLNGEPTDRGGRWEMTWRAEPHS